MTSVQSRHALPPAPGSSQQYSQQYPQQYQQQYQQQYPQQEQTRPRSKSSFSFRSDKSHKSSGSKDKIDLTETSREKHARRLTTKADPSMALAEAEPSAVASGVASKLAPLRAIQHLDSLGNPISDPDRSNPTRSRWERPLDTIRAFEAAIDGNYKRQSMVRSESSDSVSAMNRRSSYYGGSNVGAMTPRFPPQNDSFYGRQGSPPRQNGGMSRPDSYYETGPPPGAGPSNGYFPNRQRYPRTASEPVFSNGHGVYPPNGNPQSYETVTTASGSGSSGEPLGYNTDPSSENSSVDRFGGPEGHGNYGGGAYGGYQGGQGMPMINEGYQNGAPAVPRKEAGMPPRVPIKLGSGASSGGPTVYEAPRPGGGEKRKSWFGKRFSKS